MKKLLTGLLASVAAIGVCAFFLLKDGGPEGGGEKFEGILRVGVECDFPPYNWEEKAKSGANVPLFNRLDRYADGYDVQIAKRIAEHMGVSLEVYRVPWDALLPALHDGQINVIISGMADTPERRALPQISNSVQYTAHPAEYCVMVRKEGRYAEAATLADFYGAKIVGQKGSMLDAVIDQIPGVNHAKPVNTADEMFTMLGRGDVDGVVIGLESTQEYMQMYPQTATVRFPKNDGFHLSFTGACAWVRKGDRALLSSINRAISSIPAEEKQELMERAENHGSAQ